MIVFPSKQRGKLMKKSTKIYLLAVMPIIAWSAWTSFTRHDERELELVIEETGKPATCTRTEQLEGQDWMACRWGKGEADYGPVWVKAGTSEDGKPVWAPVNGTAGKILENYLPFVSPERKAKLAHVKPRSPGDGLPRLAPWDQLK